METTTRTLSADVLRGSNLLDRIIAQDWVQKIDLNLLDLSDADSCILGQLFKAPYFVVLRALVQKKYIFEEDASIVGFEVERIRDHFCLSNEQEVAAYTELTNQWRLISVSRRAQHCSVTLELL